MTYATRFLVAGLLVAVCQTAAAQTNHARPNYWSAGQPGSAWRPQGARGTLPRNGFGAVYGMGSPYNSFGAGYGYGSPYAGYGGGYYGGGYGLGGAGFGYGGFRYGNYLAAFGNSSAATGPAARFYYGAARGNGGYGYGPNGYGNNDTSTYRYRGTSALPQVPPFENYAQPSPLVPYSYIYADQRTPQAPPDPETISNPFASTAGDAKLPPPAGGAKPVAD